MILAADADTTSMPEESEIPVRDRMTHTRRSLLNISCSLSLLLCLATGAMWARSYWQCFLFTCGWPVEADESKDRYVIGTPGVLFLVRVDIIKPNRTPAKETAAMARPMRWSYQSVPPSTFKSDSLDRVFFHGWTDWKFHHLGFYTLYIGDALRFVDIPYGMLLGIFAVLPAVMLMRLLRQRRRSLRKRRSLCERCGYDLRASAGRCPECGAPIPA